MDCLPNIKYYMYWKDKLLYTKLIQLQYHVMGSPYQSGETKDEGIVTEDQGAAETED